MFVIGCCIAMKVDDIPDRYEFKKLYKKDKEWVNAGDSVIVNPKGEFIAGPLSKEEGILYAEVDLKQITASKRILDVAGHYARPDIFRFTINRRANAIMQIENSSIDFPAEEICQCKQE